MGWAASTKLIHAIIYSAKDNSPQPACQWSQGNERAVRASSRLSVYDKLSALIMVEAATLDVCRRCLQNLPASMLREAAVAGFRAEKNKIPGEATSFRWLV